LTEKSRDLEALVKKREKEKRKKPNFRRQESWRYKRLDKSWRRPRGIDNKMRKKVKGWPDSPNIGYGGPKVSQGLHPSGFKEVIVHNVDELSDVKPEVEAVRIAHTVGKRKRVEIFSKAKEMGIHVLNPKEFKEPEKHTAKEKGT